MPVLSLGVLWHPQGWQAAARHQARCSLGPFLQLGRGAEQMEQPSVVEGGLDPKSLCMGFRSWGIICSNEDWVLSFEASDQHPAAL